MRLRNADILFGLEEHGIDVRSGDSAPDLRAGNLLHLWRRLWADGIDTSPVGYPDCPPSGRITTRDPDSHAVSISQAGSRSRQRRESGAAWRSTCRRTPR
ncbi:hypothetical protein SAMN04489729_7124 [Amycolatopsis lurida]|uniref:hypothetical protein n=1 Tax=Amycolatopsis lurida TaxID=31959 RepID=UPI000899B951|nr:hypothetical protein [Amycolatopsis lurida]SEE33188.1 hypothetical protein SAMN04489729_7124 [Amycolatopsis lurida]